MANPTAALRTGSFGPYPAPNGMLIEEVAITGNTSAVGTTVDYVTQFMSDPQLISPGYSMTVVKSGQTATCTIKLEHAIAGADVENIEIKGYL